MRYWMIFGCMATTAATAEIRVYQPAVSPTDVSRETQLQQPVPEPTTQAEVWQAKVEEQWKQLLKRQQQEMAPASVQIFLRPENYSAATITMLNELIQEPQVQAKNPEIYMADTGNPETLVNLLVNPDYPPLGENLEIGVDDENTRAKSYGIGVQDTLVYSGPTGAVRLYVLPYDLYRFKDQMARDGAPQP